jgi:hypothetical protein
VRKACDPAGFSQARDMHPLVRHGKRQPQPDDASGAAQCVAAAARSWIDRPRALPDGAWRRSTCRRGMEAAIACERAGGGRGRRAAGSGGRRPPRLFGRRGLAGALGPRRRAPPARHRPRELGGVVPRQRFTVVDHLDDGLAGARVMGGRGCSTHAWVATPGWAAPWGRGDDSRATRAGVLRAADLGSGPGTRVNAGPRAVGGGRWGGCAVRRGRN